MNVFIISFLPDPNRSPHSGCYQPLQDAIDTYRPRLIAAQTYIIKTEQSAWEVWQNIHSSVEAILTDQDNLSVISVSKPFQGYGPRVFRDWLVENLPDEMTN